MRTHPDILRSLDRLAGAESAFLAQEFLAPALRSAKVRVRIAGVICQLAVEPAGLEGLAVFHPVSYRAARLVRAVTMLERVRYLSLFPSVRLIVSARRRSQAQAIASPDCAARLQIEGPVPVSLVDSVDPFDSIIARFDGVRFWFDSLDQRADPSHAVWLRYRLAEMLDPAKLDRFGLLPAHRAAYALAFDAEQRRRLADEQSRAQYRLGRALQHAGAELRQFSERGDVYRVTFALDGQEHTSIVRARDLTVETAGICLSGQDRDFDLASLVGVLRESSLF